MQLVPRIIDDEEGWGQVMHDMDRHRERQRPCVEQDSDEEDETDVGDDPSA